MAVASASTCSSRAGSSGSSSSSARRRTEEGDANRGTTCGNAPAPAGPTGEQSRARADHGASAEGDEDRAAPWARAGVETKRSSTGRERGTNLRADLLLATTCQKHEVSRAMARSRSHGRQREAEDAETTTSCWPNRSTSQPVIDDCGRQHVEGHRQVLVLVADGAWIRRVTARGRAAWSRRARSRSPWSSRSDSYGRHAARGRRPASILGLDPPGSLRCSRVARDAARRRAAATLVEDRVVVHLSTRHARHSPRALQSRLGDEPEPPPSTRGCTIRTRFAQLARTSRAKPPARLSWRSFRNRARIPDTAARGRNQCSECPLWRRSSSSTNWKPRSLFRKPTWA